MWRRHCESCKPFVQQVLQQYVVSARDILGVTGPLGQEWTDLHTWLDGAHVPRQDALAKIKPDAIEWLRRYAAFAHSDGVITDDELGTFRRATQILGLAVGDVAALDGELARQHMLTRIRSGQLPTVPAPALHLPLDEQCFLLAPATRWRDLKSGPQPTQGQLVVTNRKIRFVALQHGGETPLSKLHRVNWVGRDSIALDATNRSLTGRFAVHDPEYAATIIDTALRIDRRVLLNNDGASRSIPQHVKAAVWQRDQGRCCECGANSYLEFDHIIPFSLGGASTVDNLQLLCLRCNRAKGARL